jgi:hypothetical protein
MIEVAFRCRPSVVLAGRRVIGRVQGEVDRGWQDKSRKVRPVDRLGNASKFKHAPNIAKLQRNLSFLIGHSSSSVFDTLRCANERQ